MGDGLTQGLRCEWNWKHLENNHSLWPLGHGVWEEVASSFILNKGRDTEGEAVYLLFWGAGKTSSWIHFNITSKNWVCSLGQSSVLKSVLLFCSPSKLIWISEMTSLKKKKLSYNSFISIYKMLMYRTGWMDLLSLYRVYSVYFNAFLIEFSPPNIRLLFLSLLLPLSSSYCSYSKSWLCSVLQIKDSWVK